jgi:hypothetical protein
MSTCKISTLPAEIQKAFRDCLVGLEKGLVGPPLLDLVGVLQNFRDKSLDPEDLLHQIITFLLLLKAHLPESTTEWTANVLRAPSNLPQDLKCSFCGKDQSEVAKLIAGPAILICNDCIGVCNDILEPEPGTKR